MSIVQKIKRIPKFVKEMERKRKKRKYDELLAGLKRVPVCNCWCGGRIDNKSHPHPSYGVCVQCGSHVNTNPLAEDEIRKFYGYKNYWHDRQAHLGHPNIRQRAENDLKDGRVQAWLNWINHYAPTSGKVVEVGCAHGVLLSILRDQGYDCLGLEVDPEVAEWTSNTTGVEVRSGLFPDVDLPSCDIFLAFDVLEHCPSPRNFLEKVHYLLKPNGRAIIQSPILIERLADSDPLCHDRMHIYNEYEHLFVLSEKAINLLTEEIGMQIIILGEGWKPGHEYVVLKKILCP